ncbi:MAG: NUDIX hydrolase [Muribaculaceae bacterium]|nr:NUDIX hydrolase [Muribaculaceae bacterium]
MAEFYKSNHRYYLSVDCVVLGLNSGKLSILLTRRAFAPEEGKWSLMGGFVQPDESIDQAAKRVLTQLTGLSNIYMEQVGAFGEVDRDPGDRVISIAYYALINFDEHDRRKVLSHNACWVEMTDMPELGFDHPAMIARTLEKLRFRFVNEPIGLKLLPRQFTLSQMQSLYEAVLGHPLDKRNFRKRVQEATCIEPTGEIDKLNSKRGAALYRFNAKTYERDKKFKI